jgi:hypothetical protein
MAAANRAARLLLADKASFRRDAEFGRNRGKADIDQAETATINADLFAFLKRVTCARRANQLNYLFRCALRSPACRLANRMRANLNLLKQFNLICPVQSYLKKFSASPLTQIKSISSAVPPHTEGRFAIVTDVGCGMRWTQAALLTRAPACGRRSRVVLTPRRWRQVCGRYSAGDGGKQARSPGRARYKP